MRPELTEEAVADLKDIGRYSLRKWGANQRRVYMEAIEKKMDFVARKPNLGRPRSDLGPDCSSAVVGEHVLFYRRDRESVTILRVLHQSRDVTRHLELTPDTEVLATAPEKDADRVKLRKRQRSFDRDR